MIYEIKSVEKIKSEKIIVKFQYVHCPEEITSIFFLHVSDHADVLTDHKIWASGNIREPYAHNPSTSDIYGAITSIVHGFESQAVGSKDIFWEVIKLPDSLGGLTTHDKYIDKNGNVVSKDYIKRTLTTHKSNI